MGRRDIGARGSEAAAQGRLNLAGDVWAAALPGLLLLAAIPPVLGTSMDLVPLIIICTSVFLPVARAFGVDPVHFGIVLIMTACIGLITPPVGSVLFVGCAIGRIGVTEALRSIWPFYAASVAVLLLVVLFPQLSLWLPHALKH